MGASGADDRKQQWEEKHTHTHTHTPESLALPAMVSSELEDAAELHLISLTVGPPCLSLPAPPDIPTSPSIPPLPPTPPLPLQSLAEEPSCSNSGSYHRGRTNVVVDDVRYHTPSPPLPSYFSRYVPWCVILSAINSVYTAATYRLYVCSMIFLINYCWLGLI